MCNQEEWVSLYKLLIYTIYTSEPFSVILLFSVRSSAVTVHFSWLLNLKSAVSWGSNFALHSLATYLLFQTDELQHLNSSSLMLWIVWPLKAMFPSISLFRRKTVPVIKHMWDDDKLRCEEPWKKAKFPVP